MANDHIKLGRIVLGLSTIAIFAKIIGFGEKLVIAHFFGTDTESDVYFACTTIVLSIVFMTKELFHPSLLPVLSRNINNSPDSATELLRKTFSYSLIILLVFCLAIMLFAPYFAKFFVPGFTGKKLALTTILLKLLAPAIVFMSMSMIVQITLYSYKKFIRASLPEALFKVIVLVGIIILAPFAGINSVGIVLIVGSITVFLIQFYFVPNKNQLFRKSPSNDNCNFIDVLRLMSPIAAGVLFSHVSGIVDNMLASTLDAGNLSFLGYSKKLIDAALLVGPVAVMTVVYSQLSHLAASQKNKEFKKLFVRTFKLILYISIPIAIALVIFDKSIVEVLFERGKFTTESTLGTSKALTIYGIGFITLSLEGLAVYSFYAMANTKTPVKIGIGGVCLDIILALILIKSLGFAGIAWAFVISKTVKILILFGILEMKFNFIKDRQMLSFLLKVIIISLFATATIYMADYAIPSRFSKVPIFHLAFLGGIFFISFILGSLLLRIEELGFMFKIITTRKKPLKDELIGEQI